MEIASRNFTYNSRLTQLLTNAFVVQNCLHVIIDDGLLSNLIAKTLMNSSTPAVIFSDGTKSDLACDGYVIASSNFTSLQNLFGKNSGFEAHKRAIIFYEGRKNFLVEPFTSSSSQRAVDLYVVQGSWYKDEPLYKQRKLARGKFKQQPEPNFWNFWENPDINRRRKLVGGELLLQPDFAGKRNLQKRRDTPDIIDVYKRRKLNGCEFEHRTWRPDFTTEPNLKFKAAVFNCSPFVMINSKQEVFDGLEHRILKEIIGTWPFEYKVHVDTFSKDSYMELSYDILNGTSDIALGFHWLTFTLLRKVDASYPYTQACATFLVPKPQLVPDVSFVFQPVTPSLWLAILVATCLAALSLFTSANYYVSQAHFRDEHGFHNFVVCFMNLLAILVINTLKRFPPPNLSVFRLIITSWCFICVVLSTGYSAGFSSLLTYPKFWKHINTLQDMIDANVYWGESSSFTRDYLATSGQVKLVKLADLYQREGTREEKLFRLKQNTHATIVTVLPKRFLTGTFKLDDYTKAHLRVLSECFGLYDVVFALPKNSPYKKMIQEKIIRYGEHGLMAYWYKEILTKYDYMHFNGFFTNYVEPVSTRHIPLAVGKIQGAFLLLVVGWFCSGLMFLVELVRIPKRVVVGLGPSLKPRRKTRWRK